MPGKRRVIKREEEDEAVPTSRKKTGRKVAKKAKRTIARASTGKADAAIADSLVTAIGLVIGKENVLLMSSLAKTIMAKPRHWIKTEFRELNRILSKGRGFPTGKIIEIYGAEGTGKTALCQYLIRLYQKLGGIAIYLDFETSMDVEQLKSYGLDLGNLIYVDVETAEEGFDAIATSLIAVKKIQMKTKKDFPVLIIWDSVAMALPKAEMEEKGHDSSHMALLARALSKGMRKFRRKIAHSSVTAVFTNQIRDKPGVKFGAKTAPPGGYALKFAASIRLNTFRLQSLTADKKVNGKTVKIAKGLLIGVNTVKTRFAPYPQKAAFILSFKEGPSPGLTMKHYLKTAGLLKSVGKTLSIEGVGECRPSEWKGFYEEHRKEIEELLDIYEGKCVDDSEEGSDESAEDSPDSQESSSEE